MRRPSGEVNGSKARAVACAVASLSIVIALSGCGGPERRAERLWRQALDHVAQGDTSGAVVDLQRILDEYPDTEVAGRARKQIVLYRGLESAVQSYPTRRAREVMIQVARAIESFRSRERRFPSGLADLVPSRLPSVPLDPWDHPLQYEVVAGRYRLRCLGSDGLPGGSGDAADLLVVNGDFVAVRP